MRAATLVLRSGDCLLREEDGTEHGPFASVTEATGKGWELGLRWTKTSREVR